MSKHLWSLAFLATALAGCATPPTKYSKPQPLDINTFARKWAIDLPAAHGAVLAIYVREDLVFAYTRDGTSIVVDRNQGRIAHLETIAGGTDVLHGPVLLKETIVYPTLTTLQVYDRKSGRFNRASKLPYAIRTNAVGAKNMLFLGVNYQGGGRLAALDLSREYVPTRWELMFPGAAISAGPALFNDSVFAGGEDGNVAAVASDTREPLWPLTNSIFQTGGPIRGDLFADESGVYVASYDSKLYCINRTSGKVKWLYYAQTPLVAGPVVTKDLVLEMVPGEGLVALDKIEGVNKNKPPAYNRHPRWIVEDATQILGEDEKFVYLRRTDNAIIAADKVDGHTVFTSKRKDFIVFGVNTKDGTIYAATKGGQLIAVQAVTKPGMVGELVWDTRPASETPIFADVR